VNMVAYNRARVQAAVVGVLAVPLWFIGLAVPPLAFLAYGLLGGLIAYMLLSMALEISGAVRSDRRMKSKTGS